MGLKQALLILVCCVVFSVSCIIQPSAVSNYSAAIGYILSAVVLLVFEREVRVLFLSF